MNRLELLKRTNTLTWWYAFLVCITSSLLQGITFDYIFNPTIEDKLIASLVSFISSLIFIFLYVRFFEKNSLKTLGFKNSSIFKSISIGFILAISVIFVIISTIAALTDVIVSVSNENNYKLIFLVIILFSIQGFTEEIVFRGYLMNRIAALKGKWVGVFINSLFFTIFHIANPSSSYLSSLNIYIIGVVLSLIFWYTDNIIIVGIFHGTWNVIIGVVLGINLSGINISYSIFKIILNSNNKVVIGGEFGIEASIITTIFFVLFGIVIYISLYFQMFKRINKK